MMSKQQAYQSKLSQSRKFKKQPHQFTKKVCHWMYCSGCGLVALKNESTRKRIEQSCESMEE